MLCILFLTPIDPKVPEGSLSDSSPHAGGGEIKNPGHIGGLRHWIRSSAGLIAGSRQVVAFLDSAVKPQNDELGKRKLFYDRKVL